MENNNRWYGVTFGGTIEVEGYYEIGAYRFELPKKPSWFHRTLTRLFFGFKWVDKP